MVRSQVTVSLDQDTLDWLDKKIKDKTFANRSHGLEYAVAQLMKQETS